MVRTRRYFLEGDRCPTCKDHYKFCACTWDDLEIKQRRLGDFTITQTPERTPLRTVICSCGNDTFKIGSGEAYNIMKCTVCGLETGV